MEREHRMNTIDTETVIKTLHQVASERPDYVYSKPEGADGPRCLYVHGDQPGCIAGTVLNRLGVPLDTLREFEGSRVSSVLGAVRVRDALDALDAVEVLGRAQREQDNGKPWGEAARLAIEAHEDDERYRAHRQEQAARAAQ